MTTTLHCKPLCVRAVRSCQGKKNAKQFTLEGANNLFFFCPCPTPASLQRTNQRKPRTQAGKKLHQANSFGKHTHLYIHRDTRASFNVLRSQSTRLHIHRISTSCTRTARDKETSRAACSPYVPCLLMDPESWRPQKRTRLLTTLSMNEPVYSRIPGCRIQLRAHRESTRQPCKENNGSNVSPYQVCEYTTNEKIITPNFGTNVNR